MTTAEFSPDDWSQIEAHGISRAEALRHIEILTRLPRYVKLERPATLGDGVQSLMKADLDRYEVLHDKARRAGRLLKFVPASGAATRLFAHLQGFLAADADTRKKLLSGPTDVRAFWEGLACLPFYDDLKKVMTKNKLNPVALLKKGELAPLVECLLSPKGLNYANKPKGLLLCHRYGKAPRTLVEENLIEAAECVKSADGVCRLHFTVSEEHKTVFEKFMKECVPPLEKSMKARFDVAFSCQKKHTDTLAVDMAGRPARAVDGKLMFRPGGHGSLLSNLDSLKGDIVYIKNIDNAVPERLQPETFRWKKALAGLLIEIQEELFQCIRWIDDHPEDEQVISDALRFLLRRLAISVPPRIKTASIDERRRYLMAKLNRPLRVCGMVANEGEPGGGPFWVKNKWGDLSLQIVERAQVDPSADEQQDIFSDATHFNPVDMACGLRDWQGQSFLLNRFVDPEAVFVTKKMEADREIMALERPGLWNGAMSEWNTVLVEVPSATFQPIKTVNDLLRPGHQPDDSVKCRPSLLK